MRTVLVLAIVLSASLAGCIAQSAGSMHAGAGTATIDLHCRNADKGVIAMESSYLGSCWGHVGHHTYFLGQPHVLHHVAGRVFAVEIAYTTLADDAEPVLPVQVSLDGSNWTTVAGFDYPLGQDPEDRYEIFTSATVEDVPFRFLRVHMPRSAHEGLAGYLDASNFTLAASPAANAPPEPAPQTSADCRDGLLDSFFPEHPCWFGGYDNLDRQQGGDPDTLHASWDIYDESWFDAPSFLHTYYLSGVGGRLQADVTVQMWRLFHYGLCSGLDPLNTPVAPTVVAEASPDGQQWSLIAQEPGSYLDPVHLEGDVPDDTRFVRFGAGRGASYSAGGCHHPVAFVVDSRLTIT